MLLSYFVIKLRVIKCLFIYDNAIFIIILQIIFFYFYLNIPIPYARKIFKIFRYFSKIFPNFFLLTKQFYYMECAIGRASRAMALPDFKVVGPAIHLALPNFFLNKLSTYLNIFINIFIFFLK